MSFASDMEDAARDYAAGLRKRGYLDVAVFRYDTPLDNREPYRRDHRTAFGWAVRYTSSPETDAEVWKGSDGERKGWPLPKFHDRSVTMFTAPAGLVSCDAWLTQDRLTAAAVIADFAGEDAVPMYVSHWSPGADQPGVHPENVPLVPTVGLKRFPARKDDSSYPWQVGPRRFYHVIMTPMRGRAFHAGAEARPRRLTANCHVAERSKDMSDLHPSDTLDNLRKAFPAGPRIGVDRGIPRDSYTGQRVVVRVKPAGTIGYTQPWGLTRTTIAGRRYYRAEWLDTGNRALFTAKRDADLFIDLHRYAEGMRRITGELPAWAAAAE